MSAAAQQVYAAWVSAGAAVVQAVAAAVAIWYSGKLARDSAAREKAADEANARRIDEANAAATKQRRLDHEAAERARNLAEVRVFNEPVSLALGYAEQGLRELRVARDNEQARAQAFARDQHQADVTPGQLLIGEQLPTLIERAKDAESAVAIRHLMTVFRPSNAYNTAMDWLPLLDRQIEAVVAGIEALREQIIHPD